MRFRPLNPLDRINLRLSLVATVLGLVIWGLLQLEEDHPGQPLTQIDPASISSIDLYQHEQLRMSLLETGSGWQMTHPQVSSADQEAVSNLLGILNIPSLPLVSIDQDKPERLHLYGLDKPGYRLRLSDTEISFGNAEPTSNLRYVRVGQQVYLIGEGYLRHLISAPQGFIPADTAPPDA